MGFARASAGLLNVDNAGDFERLGRMSLSFARSLRLTPQSRTRPETLARRYVDQHTGPKPWDRNRDEDDYHDEDK